MASDGGRTVLKRYIPGLTALAGYDRNNLRFDLVAGLSVAAVALPVGIAYSEIAGVPTVVGIYSAIFPLFAYALFGSSPQLMVGPDAATCIMAAAAVGAVAGGDPERYGLLMVALTLMTGVFYILAGLARFGFIANFLSRPILVGYLHGIALMILIGQLPKLFGFAGGGEGFFAQVGSFVSHLGATHGTTLLLGVSLLVLLLVLRRALPRVPAPLIVAAAGVLAVVGFDLADRGVAVLGAVPGGFPPLRVPLPAAADLPRLISDAAGLTLISFTSGVLTAKSFASRGGYDVDANQELIGFGASNLASGLFQGFPVTGADSRTAVNNATGGRTQLVGVVAGLTMLAFLLFATSALALLPNAALAAIIIVSASGFFDLAALRALGAASWRELLFSLATTVGVLYFGVLPGVLVAVVLSLLWLLVAASRPHDAVLGRVDGSGEWRDLNETPRARQTPGLLIYRFDANLVFFNCDHFKERVLELVRSADSPVEWVVIDAGPVNVVDFTGLSRLEELEHALASRGTLLVFANVKDVLLRFFRREWAERVRRQPGHPGYVSLEAAVEAFEARARPAGPPSA
jgi:high affinity sulfate transporter 1